MSRNNPTKAYRRYLEALNEAISCITHDRLIGDYKQHGKVIEAGPIYALSTPNGGPIQLRGHCDLEFTAGQWFQVIHDPEMKGTGPYKVRTIRYRYKISLPGDKELMSYHWSPETELANEVKYPHLHLDSRVVADDTAFLPKTFNKLHIATGRVSLESIIRFLIEEAGVESKRSDYASVLDKNQQKFDAFKTRY